MAETERKPILTDDQIKQLQLQLMVAQLRELQTKLSKQDEAEEQEKRARASGAKAQEQRRQQRLLEQSSCLHLKPYGTSNLVAQRTHGPHVIWLCQACQKEWLNGETPNQHLRNIPHIGGPAF